MTLEDIGEGNDALLCMTSFTACCRPPYTATKSSLGNWFFPNGTVVPSNGAQWDFYRNRGQMVVRLNRRSGGVEGMYQCVIPDSLNVTLTIYIGVYTGGTGEWYMSIQLFVSSIIILLKKRNEQKLVHRINYYIQSNIKQ